MPGNNTPITPMLAPASTLPANKPISPNELRRMIPPASVSRIPNTTRSAPKRRASIGANGANKPRHSTGKVVSKPACAADKPRLFDTSLSIGAMLDSAGRRFSATRIRPSNNSHGRRRIGWLCWTCFVIGLGVDQQLFELRRAFGFVDVAIAAGHGVLGFKVH